MSRSGPDSSRGFHPRWPSGRRASGSRRTLLRRIYGRAPRTPAHRQSSDACGGTLRLRADKHFRREVEEFLHTHPKIGDVQVFGVPDRKYGEEVCAWIRLRDGQKATEDEIRDYCRGQIATYKIPRYVRFTTEFPMTVTGKVQKFRMREEMMRELC